MSDQGCNHGACLLMKPHMHASPSCHCVMRDKALAFAPLYFFKGITSTAALLAFFTPGIVAS